MFLIHVPTGPRRPILEALDDNEIFHGFVRSIEDSSVYQREKLESDGWKFVEEEGRFYHTIHDIDGESWHLETLFDEDFPRLQRIAAFLAIWGRFEHRLNELCLEIKRAESLDISVRDLRDTGIKGTRFYLTKVAGLSGDWTNRFWQEIPKLQDLRGILAHTDGRLLETHRKHQVLRPYVEQSPHLKLAKKTDENEVHLKATFLPHVLKVQRDFLTSLRDSVVERFPVRK